MNAQRVIEDFSRQGINLWAEGDLLRFKATIRPLQQDEIATLKKLKPELMAHFRGESPKLEALPDQADQIPQRPQTPEALANRAKELLVDWQQANCEVWDGSAKHNDLVTNRCKAIADEIAQIEANSLLYEGGYYITFGGNGPQLGKHNLDANGLFEDLPKPERIPCPTCGVLGWYWPDAADREADYYCKNKHRARGYKATAIAKTYQKRVKPVTAKGDPNAKA